MAPENKVNAQKRKGIKHGRVHSLDIFRNHLMIIKARGGTEDIRNVKYMMRRKEKDSQKREPRRARSQDRSSRASLHPNIHHRQRKPVLDRLDRLVQQQRLADILDLRDGALEVKCLG